MFKMRKTIFVLTWAARAVWVHGSLTTKGPCHICVTEEYLDLKERLFKNKRKQKLFTNSQLN